MEIKEANSKVACFARDFIRDIHKINLVFKTDKYKFASYKEMENLLSSLRA